MNRVKIIKKNVKNLTLKVKPSCEVILVAPYFVDDATLNNFIKKHKNWIQKKVEFFKSKQIFSKKYVNGEDFYYLGKKYILKIIESKDEKIEIDIKYCYLMTKDKDNFNKKEKIVKKWYKQKAKEIFYEIITKYQSIVQKDISKITIREMKTRWGSCNYQKGYINLNLELIKKPIFAIEYVIFHELTHLIYPNHSKAFYDYIKIHMPDWKQRKNALKEM